MSKAAQPEILIELQISIFPRGIAQQRKGRVRRGVSFSQWEKLLEFITESQSDLAWKEL